jgi:hypothetical protein
MAPESELRPGRALEAPAAGGALVIRAGPLAWPMSWLPPWRALACCGSMTDWELLLTWVEPHVSPIARRDGS